MLVYGIKLAILSGLSIATAAFLSRNLFFSDVGKKALAVWILALPLVFMLANERLTLWASMVILFLINRGNKPIISLVFFIVILGAVPDWVAHFLSAPGINHLLRFTYDKIAILAILLPLFMSVVFTAQVKWNLTDTLVSLFVLLMILLAFRDGKFTAVLRFSFDTVLTYVIPYFVFSRVVRSIKDLHYCAVAFLMLSILLSAIFVISQVMQLDIYEAFNPRSQYNVIREYRGGFLRIAGPMMGILVGFILLAGYFSWEAIKRFGFINTFLSWAMLFSFVMSLLFTGSRGAMFGIILGMSVYFYFAKFTGLYRTLTMAFIVILLMIEFTVGLSSIIAYEDEYGTFDYRSELHKTTWEFLKIYPLFGQHNYLGTGFFNHLVTGLGIIDIVSAYVGIALQYGYVGLTVFVGMFLSVLVPLGVKLFACKEFESDYPKYLAMYFTLIVVIMFMISTTSIISYFPVFIMIVLGVARSLCDSQQFLETAER